MRIAIAADKSSMDVVGAPSLTRLAASTRNANLGHEISAAVTKQILAQLKQQGEAIVEMMEQSTELVKNGHIDIYA